MRDRNYDDARGFDDPRAAGGSHEVISNEDNLSSLRADSLVTIVEQA
jgi:hypothetical protein